MNLSLTTRELISSETLWYTDPVSKITFQTEPISYEILHAIPGRLRVSIPRLAEDQAYAEQLKNTLQSISFVTEVRINSKARSIVINYTNDSSQEQAIQQSILTTIQEINFGIFPLKELEKWESDWLVNEITTLMNSTVKGFLPTIGTISLVLGIVGVILPLIPGTPFLLFSSFCYSLADDS